MTSHVENGGGQQRRSFEILQNMDEDFKESMSHNCICMKCKQVFEIEQNVVYHVRLVACGYSQGTRLNFSKNYLMVAKDIMFSILILILIKFGFSSKTIDIETALLYRELVREIYMEFPPSMKDFEKMNASF